MKELKKANEKYTDAELEVIVFSSQDVIMTTLENLGDWDITKP